MRTFWGCFFSCCYRGRGEGKTVAVCCYLGFVCLYVQGFCGVVVGVCGVWKKKEAGNSVGLGLGLGLEALLILQIPSFFLFSGFIRNVPISCYLSYRHSIIHSYMVFFLA